MMLRLARSCALRPRTLRVVGTLPQSPRLSIHNAPLHHAALTLRFRSSTADINCSSDWEERAKPAYLAFLKQKKHLMIPVAFQVPSGDATWPESTWGFALGKHAAKLRKQWREGGRKIDLTLLKELDEMPFAWDWPEYKWNYYFLPGLRRFHDLNGHTDVPVLFRVPTGDLEWPEHLWGYRLGKKVIGLRSSGYFAKQVARDSQELKRLDLCFESSIVDRDWNEKIIPTLKVFRQEFGHCNVSCSFVVPSTHPWPKKAWSMRLGEIVGNIRARNQSVYRDKSELDELGFVWDYYEAEWSDRIMPALEAFHRAHDHCRVPISFVVPSDETWPKQCWGMNLGKVVSAIRSQGSYSTQVSRGRSRLEALGFVSGNYYETEWTERIMPALETFYHVNDHCRVPKGFVVPSDETWPKQCWETSLGKIVRTIRNHGSYSTQVSRDRSRLEALGFVTGNYYETEWTERIMPALETFYQVNDHCRVPISFVVPSDETWPKCSWGMKLGKIVGSIRSQGSYDVQVSRDKLRLEEMGFVWDFHKAEWCDRILPTLEVFYREYGHSRVPPGFEVPFEANWPKETHGLKVGSVVQRIRLKGAYFDFTVRAIDALNAIKFDLKIPASKWNARVEPLLVVFEELHGHRDVPFEFVVPASAAWKMKDWGIPLGKLKWK